MPKEGKGRIFEYFLVCGIKNSKGLIPFKSGLEQFAEDDSDLEKLISPLQQTYQASILNYYPAKDVCGKIDHQAVTTLCFPHGVSLYEHLPQDSVKFHPFIITREDGSKVHAATLTFYEKVEGRDILQQINNLCKEFHRDLQKTTVGRLSSFKPLEQLYATKTLCVLMSQAFHRAAETVLRHIHSVAMTVRGTLPVESYVYNILYEVPLPPPGRSTKFYSGKKTLVCYRPGGTELPLLDYPMTSLVILLGAEKLVTVFTCAMLEQRILVRSTEYDRLMMACECLISLLFPFTWAHVYVPILPASMQHFLDAPVPFIMGLWKDTSLPEDEEIAGCEMCLVDLDLGTVEPPEDLPLYPHSDDLIQEIKALCIKYKIKLQDADIDSGMSSQEGSPANTNEIDSKSDIEMFGSSSRLAELEAIAVKAGVISSMADIRKEVLTEKKKEEADDFKKLQDQNKALQDLNVLKFTECLREIFLGCQLKLFAHYEKFVIYPTQCDLSSWLFNREMMQNFDKEAFLGDQPAVYQHFICHFLETQMFATFIDHKIMSQWQDPEHNVRVFDLRNNIKMEENDENSDMSYEQRSGLEHIDSLIEQRVTSSDYVALAPHILEGLDKLVERSEEMFPELDAQILTKPLPEEDVIDTEITGPQSPERSRHPSEKAERPKITRKPSIAFDRKQPSVNEAYLQFITPLLRECKAKTNRMLVGKMGEEAVQLGHADPALLGLEENTMIASLCDLLERIWSHGLSHKQSKSPLWAHLSAFAGNKNMTEGNQVVDAFNAKQEGAFTAVLISAGMKLLYDLNMSNLIPSDSVEKTLTHRRKGSFPERLQTLQPLPNNLLVDIKHVQDMQEIKTDVGRARAFVRLSLEKKLLAKHLKELLSNHDLLKHMYKRVAFLRSEDEREQAVYHLLSLNTADYRCFTDAFTNAVISYRVLVIPGKRFAGGASTTTANVWVSVAGQLRDSDRKWLPKNCMDFTFESKNLGQLSTVRIGHDNSGMAPKWLVDNVLVRNETTGQIVKFACGRWLGRGVDDDSTERILVGEVISFKAAEAMLECCQNSPRKQKDSPKPSRRPSDIKNCKTQMQQRLSDAVNNLLKHFHKPEKERESVTLLLCGENGLVTRLEEMLSMGFKSTRLFRSNLYIWDYLENVLKSIMNNDSESCRSFVANLSIINNSLQDVGKDGKLQLLLCLAVRDHLLPEWLFFLHKCPITKQMYEDSAFLLDEPQIQFLVNLLSTLRIYHISLEPSITKGLDI